MITVYYPIRYAVSFDNNAINIVQIIDEASKDFFTIEHFQFESFFNKALLQEPLILLEDFELDIVKAKKGELELKVLIRLFERYLISKKANYELVGCPMLPRAYRVKYTESKIPVNYHKPLWLCCYNRHKSFEMFEKINNE